MSCIINSNGSSTCCSPPSQMYPNGNCITSAVPTSLPACNSTIGQCVCSFNGCTDMTAINYDTNATCDDGTCIPYIYGCTDATADNFNQNANTDDGGCLYNTGNTYNTGNLVCWNDACPYPSQMTPGTATTCPSTHPFPNPPVCTIPSVPLVISLNNLVGVYNEIDCVGAVDINITGMPSGSTWVMRKEELRNIPGVPTPIWGWSPSMGTITNGNYLTPSQSLTGLCPGRYMILVYHNGNNIQGRSLFLMPPSTLPAIEVISTTNTSPPSCDGEVKFKIRQQCHPTAPPWSNCNMSAYNKSTFVIKDSTNNIVVNSAGQSWGENGQNNTGGSYVYNLKTSGSSITYAGGTKSRSWMNINLCPGNYTLELFSSGSGPLIETTTFNIQ